ncbi:hypothetical protein IGI04_035739 [Brassica rapa subsp. trilocularis]|uniref:Uncharacterized protein n=1 Tax=Brassica rapa subsp. trilocularis TaxID=1813537 RepID=A0ABQ7LFE0_BRACM|nr:hypothetical protein IGI04_035739 [Brassica rapa subsp. trilocularis]
MRLLIDPKSRRTHNLLSNTVIPTSIYFYLQFCAQENGKGGMSNKLLTLARPLPHIPVDSTTAPMGA